MTDPTLLELWTKRFLAATEVVLELESIYQPDGSGVPYEQLIAARQYKAQAKNALRTLEADAASAQAQADVQAAGAAVLARLHTKLR